MKKWYIWVALILIVINLSALITMMINSKHDKAYEMQSGVSSEESASVKYSGRWFRDELGLTREQMREFQHFNPSFRQKVRNINSELEEKRKHMLDEMDAENSDTARLNILSDSIGMLHSELKKKTYSYYLEFKRISTPEQKEKLKDIFSRIFEGEIPAGPGRGMQGGGRFGMQHGQYQNKQNK
jgi:Spy/CpxP family protein refolding chaperone